MYVCVRVHACMCEEDVHEKRVKKEKRKRREKKENRNKKKKRKRKEREKDKHFFIQINTQTDRRMDGQIDTNHSLL